MLHTWVYSAKIAEIVPLVISSKKDITVKLQQYFRHLVEWHIFMGISPRSHLLLLKDVEFHVLYSRGRKHTILLESKHSVFLRKESHQRLDNNPVIDVHSSI